MKSALWPVALALTVAGGRPSNALAQEASSPATQPAIQTAQSNDAPKTSLLQGHSGETPKGWFVPTPGYTANLMEAHQASTPDQHGVLLRPANAAQAPSVGNLMRTFNAVPYRGKQLRFRAKVRFEATGTTNILRNDQAHLWMRVDRAANAGPSFFDNMEDRPIKATTWQSYEIVAPIAPEAASVSIGLLLIGRGKAWMDNAEVDIFDGKAWNPLPNEKLSALDNAPAPGKQPAAQANAPLVAKETAALQGAVGATPQGWFVPTEGYSALLIAEGANPGQMGLLLQKNGKAAGKAAFGNIMRTFNAQPFQGKKMRFRAVARFDGSGAGNAARLWMRVDRAKTTEMGFFDNMGDHPITAIGWRPYSISGQIDADAEHINIGFMLLGEGKAWMSDVVVEVFDGAAWKPVPAEQLTLSYAPPVKLLDPQREKALVAQLKAQAIPLATVEAGNGFEDLAPLDKIVGDARIVALGEASHGTREFFQMKHRLLEYLVNKKGFTVFAIEANWPEVEVADHYIKTGEGDTTAALDAMYFWTWHTKEVADMIQWMRDYNKQPGAHPILSFSGFDMQTPDVAAKQVLDYLAKADRGVLESVRKAYAHISQTAKADRRNSAPEILAADQPHAAEILKLLDDKRATLVKATSEADFRHARQCARIVQQAAKVNTPGQNMYAVRDLSMAENVRWLADEVYPNQKIMLWAHNGHVGDGTIVDAASMGHHLRQMFGKQMVVFGFGFDFGEIRALTLKDNKMTTGPIPQKVPTAIAGSAEALLRQAGSPRYLIDFRSIPPTSPLGLWLAEDQLMREPGAAYAPDEPEAMFSPLILSKTYDGLIFIRESHASMLLPYGAAPKSQEKR